MDKLLERLITLLDEAQELMFDGEQFNQTKLNWCKVKEKLMLEIENESR